MKKVFLLIFVSFLWNQLNAQILGYNDLGVLMSSHDKETSARSMAMKNAFGALGGDLSAISINPAGTAVFSNSAASMTLGYTQADLDATFYGTKTLNNNETFNLTQLGAVLVFENDFSQSNLKTLNFAINYQTLNNFNKSWIAQGISYPTWIDDPVDPNIFYDQLESQKYNNITSGNQTELNFSVGADYDNTWFFGASFNAYDFKFIEDATRQEIANDGNGNSVDAFESFWQEQTGDGFSVGLGFIYKPIHNIRLGLSYLSPTWYEMHEDSNMFKEYDGDQNGYYNVIYSNDPLPYENNDSKILSYDYQLRTPASITGSIAYVFDKNGLISLDVARKNFKGIQVSPKSEFLDVNQYFDDNLKNIFTVNVGTEWRYEQLSFRGGYSFSQNPYVNSLNTDNLTGYALGLGVKLGNVVIDVAYDYAEQTDYFNFYSDLNLIDGAELTKNKHKIMTTLSLNF